MNPVIPDLAGPIRAAILNNTAIVALLPVYLGSRTVFTRRPAPPDAPYPLIMVSGNIAKVDQDGIADSRPLITRDLAVYGTNETAAHYRTVEEIADILFAMFDKVHNAIDVETDGWNLVGIYCTGPIVAPVDDDLHVGRIVSLQIRLGNPASG